jgi:tetratricopeptide (TPR) repeat protein
MGGAKVSTKRTVGLVLAAAALLAGCSLGRVSEMRRLQAQNAYERALTQANQGQTALALSSLQEATTLDPHTALYHDTLGLLLLDLGRVDQALAELTQAVDLDPNRGDSYFHLGTALAEARRWEDAVAAYRKAIVQPSLTALDLAHQNLGLALFHLGRYREAEEALRFALSLDPQLQAAYYNLGLVLTAEKRPEEARASFRRARQIAPESPFGQAAIERLKALGDGG